MSPRRREQQINTVPSAGSSRGSGRYSTAPEIKAHSHVWQTPVRHDHLTGTSHASADIYRKQLSHSIRSTSRLLAQPRRTTDVWIAAFVKTQQPIYVAADTDTHFCRSCQSFARFPPTKAGRGRDKSNPSCQRSVCIALVNRPGPLPKSVNRVFPLEPTVSSTPSSGSTARSRTPAPTSGTSLDTFRYDDPWMKYT
jgi:hypothetical protein